MSDSHQESSSIHEQASINRRRLLRNGMYAGAGLLTMPSWALAGHNRTQRGRAPSTTPDAEPTAGGTISLGLPHSPAGFDPYLFRIVDTLTIYNLYTRLIEYDDEFSITPSGASAWELADDRMSAVVTLTEGQTFHSGKSVTSNDLVVGIQRALDPDIGERMYALSSFVEAVEEVDDLRVRFDFAFPIAESFFTDYLATVNLIEADKNDPNALLNEPAGSGAFTLESFTPGVEFIFARFDDFVGAPAPYLDGIEGRIFDSADTMAPALQDGQIDCAAYLPARLASTLQNDYQLVVAGPFGTGTENLLINPMVEPYSSKPLRQAIQHSINRERIVADVSFGIGQPLLVPFLPTSPVYDESAREQTGFDLEVAAELWRSAGEPQSGDAIVQGENPEIQQVLQIIQSDLKEVGFEINITPLDQVTFTERLSAGDFGMAVVGAGGNLLNPASKAAARGFEPTSNAVWGDDVPEEYAQAMNDATRAGSPEELDDAAGRIRESLIDEAWINAIRTRNNLAVVTNSVHDFRFGSPHGFINLARTWVSG